MRFRLARLADLDTCRSLIHPGLRLTNAVRLALVDIWRHLMADDVACICVVEDPTRPFPRCIEMFVAGVFVSEEFAERYLATPPPHLASLIYEAILANQSPVLSLPQIRRASSGSGLTGDGPPPRASGTGATP